MLKKVCVFLIIFVLLSGCISANAATSSPIQVCADPYVSSSGIYLSSAGNAQMVITLKYQANSVSVSSCSLQTKENGNWVFAESLPTPSAVGNNTAYYIVEQNYSSYMTKGSTYRMIVVYNIDGYEKTCTSNSISY